MYLQDTLGLDTAQASRAASAFPLGSLISVLIGGFVFDRLDRKMMAWVMAGLLLTATGCLIVFATLPQWNLTGSPAMLVSLILLFVFGLCLSPCYYIPASVFSIDFGGPHSGFLVAILDAMGFAATAAFYYFGGGIAENQGWSTFLFVLAAVCLWSLFTTFFFMQREARNLRRRTVVA
jgi:MFS family permease